MSVYEVFVSHIHGRSDWRIDESQKKYLNRKWDLVHSCVRNYSVFWMVMEIPKRRMNDFGYAMEGEQDDEMKGEFLPKVTADMMDRALK